MEQFERIRRDHREEGVSIRELARRHGVHRRAVRQALASAVPTPPGNTTTAVPVSRVRAGLYTVIVGSDISVR